MKEYIKPLIEDEIIEIEDICNASQVGVSDTPANWDSTDGDLDDIFPKA